jgi:hypothetical protein
VAEGRVECSAGDHPDFYVDGIPCCDHLAGRALASAGLIRAAKAAEGRRIPVRLTAAGQAALSAPPHRIARDALQASVTRRPITRASGTTAGTHADRAGLLL